MACSNAEAFEQAQAAARTDSLTGFLNHGAIQVRIREEIWRARRSGAALTCLLADLDNFKPVNDRHGHLVGDEILGSVATAIATEFRAYDGIAPLRRRRVRARAAGRGRARGAARPPSGCEGSSGRPAPASAISGCP